MDRLAVSRAEGDVMIGARPGRRACLRHVLATAAGLAVFAVIFLYTGESEVMAAAFGGLGTVLAVYLLAEAGNGWRGSHG